MDPDDLERGSEEVVTDLQMRLAFQDDEIKQLNRTVARQQLELDALKRELKRLNKQVVALIPEQPAESGDETPPHY